MKRTMLVIAVLLLAAACGEAGRNARYSLHSSADGKVYRLNADTGEVAVIEPGGLRVIGQMNDPLGIREAK